MRHFVRHFVPKISFKFVRHFVPKISFKFNYFSISFVSTSAGIRANNLIDFRVLDRRFDAYIVF